MKMQLRLAYIELMHYHDEVMPSFFNAFIKNGWEVDIFTTSVNARKKAFCNFANAKRPRILALQGACRLFVSLGGLNQYSAVLFNTVEGLKLEEIIAHIDVPLMFIMHNGPAVFSRDVANILSRKAPRIFVLAEHIGAYLRTRMVASEWLIPVYFGTVDRREKPARNFLVQGSFVPKKRNYYGMLDAVEHAKLSSKADRRYG